VSGRVGGERARKEAQERQRGTGVYRLPRGYGRGRKGKRERLAAPWLAFQADSVNRVHYFLVISFYNSGLLS